jgi:hypothetical protein
VEVQELLAPAGACYRSHSIPLTPATRPASQASRGQGCLHGSIAVLVILLLAQ